MSFSNNNNKIYEDLAGAILEDKEVPDQLCLACGVAFICSEPLEQCPVEGCESIGTIEYFH